jgi:ATP-dependent DNA ligase
MEYLEYAYLYPPRPEKKIPPSMLGFYQNRKWVCQIKKNGTCTVIFVKGDQVIFKTRHDDDHKMWTPLPAHVEFFRSSCAGEGWNVFVGELLHSKTPHIKNQLYIFDQIVHDGVQLVGSTLLDRHELLHRRWPTIAEERDQYRVGEYVSIAKNFSKDFPALFTTLQKEDEGVVLKDPIARLRACFKSNSNDGWQTKARIPHKNYSY